MNPIARTQCRFAQSILVGLGLVASVAGCSADVAGDEAPTEDSSEEALGGPRSVDNILYAGIPGATFASKLEDRGRFCIRGYKVVSDSKKILSSAYRFEVEPHKVSGAAGGSPGALEVAASVGASVAVNLPNVGVVPDGSLGFSATFTRNIGQTANPGQYAHVMFTVKTRHIVVDLTIHPVKASWAGCDASAAATKRVTLRVPAEVASEGYASASRASKYANTPAVQSLDPAQWIASGSAFGASYKFGR